MNFGIWEFWENNHYFARQNQWPCVKCLINTFYDVIQRWHIRCPVITERMNGQILSGKFPNFTDNIDWLKDILLTSLWWKTFPGYLKAISGDVHQSNLASLAVYHLYSVQLSQRAVVTSTARNCCMLSSEDNSCSWCWNFSIAILRR